MRKDKTLLLGAGCVVVALFQSSVNALYPIPADVFGASRNADAKPDAGELDTPASKTQPAPDEVVQTKSISQGDAGPPQVSL